MYFVCCQHLNVNKTLYNFYINISQPMSLNVIFIRLKIYLILSSLNNKKKFFTWKVLFKGTFSSDVPWMIWPTDQSPGLQLAAWLILDIHIMFKMSPSPKIFCSDLVNWIHGMKNSINCFTCFDILSPSCMQKYPQLI